MATVEELAGVIEAAIGPLPPPLRAALLAVDRAQFVRSVDRAFAFENLALPLDTPDSLAAPPIAEMQAKLDKDPVLWTAKIQALRNVGLEVLEIVKKKDANALWQAGGDLDDACEGCHLEYWYPGDRSTVEAEKKFKARIEKPGKTNTPATPSKK